MKNESKDPGRPESNGATPNSESAMLLMVRDDLDGTLPREPAPLTDDSGKIWRIHPLAAMMPPMSESEFALLKESIEQAGRNRMPIQLSGEGRVLDGWHRLKACIELGIEPQTKEWDGPAGSEIDVVVDLNERRRYLTTSQRALVAARLTGLGRGRPANNAQYRALPQEEAAKKLGVSRTQVQTARTVLDKGTPELIGLVERGELSVSSAKPIAELDPEEQQPLVARGISSIRVRLDEIHRGQEKKKARANRSRAGSLSHESGAATDFGHRSSPESPSRHHAGQDGGLANGAGGDGANAERRIEQANDHAVAEAKTTGSQMPVADAALEVESRRDVELEPDRGEGGPAKDIPLADQCTEADCGGRDERPVDGETDASVGEAADELSRPDGPSTLVLPLRAGSPIPRCSTTRSGYGFSSGRPSRCCRASRAGLRRSGSASITCPGTPGSRRPSPGSSISPMRISGGSARAVGARARILAISDCGICGGAGYQYE